MFYSYSVFLSGIHWRCPSLEILSVALGAAGVPILAREEESREAVRSGHPYCCAICQLLGVGCCFYQVGEMDTSSSYYCVGMLWSLIIPQPKFLVLFYSFILSFFTTSLVSTILFSLAVGSAQLLASFLILCCPVCIFPPSQDQAAHLQPPVALSAFLGGPNGFWSIGADQVFWSFLSLPILAEFKFPGYHLRPETQWYVEGRNWGAVRLSPKDCKKLAEKDTLLPYLTLWPLGWISIWAAWKCA